jgi:RNA polymerase sigma factor (sigma-70 family)
MLSAADAAHVLKHLPVFIRNGLGLKVGEPIPSPDEVWEQIIITERPYVLSIARGIVTNAEDAEDVTQEVFMKASEALGKFRGDSEFRTWLYKITVRCARRFLARQYRERAWLEQ